MIRIRSAMVLAAGRGARLRPLTDRIPKPLVPVGGETMLDRMLDALDAFGVERVVVNTSHLAHRVEAHLRHRVRPPVTISREPRRLETGGGIWNARAHLGEQPFLVVNADVIVPAARQAFRLLADAWEDRTMDALLLLVPRGRAVGYEGEGDFRITASGTLDVGEAPRPHVFTGLQILSPRLLEDVPEPPFPLRILYDRARDQRRLHGIVFGDAWLHVGTLGALARAEAVLRTLGAAPG